MNIFDNYGERENYGRERSTPVPRIIDLHQRLAWLYGDPDARIEANEPDVAKWRALRRRRPA